MNGAVVGIIDCYAGAKNVGLLEENKNNNPGKYFGSTGFWLVLQINKERQNTPVRCI